jgi:hypothetical protein
LFDDSGDAPERPEIGIESVGLCSLQKGFFHTLLLRGSQTTVPSRASCTPQGPGALILPRLKPSTHTLPTNPQVSRYFRLSLPFAKKLACFLPPVLKLIEVPSYSCCFVHTDILRARNADVNILCEKSVTILCEIQ